MVIMQCRSMGYVSLKLRSRWRRFALIGAVIMMIVTILLNSAFMEILRNIPIFSSSPPRLNFSLFNYSSSLDSLPSFNYWIKYNSTSRFVSKSLCDEVKFSDNITETRLGVKLKPLSFNELALLHDNVNPGGHYHPQCTARYRTAIIIPYRNREAHLRTFLNNIHPFLQKQCLDYAIFVVEQKSGTMFNRGMLMNIGFNEARKLYDWSCYVFHDVDLVPEDIRNFYTCPAGPRHLSAAVDKFKYELLYATLFGGATILKKSDVILTNGFSNQFWGWGGEDDDFYERTRYANLKIVRYPLDIARYTMFSHKPDQENPVNPRRYTLIRYGKTRYKEDGINSLDYDLVKLEAKRLFTWIYVDVKGSPSY